MVDNIQVLFRVTDRCNLNCKYCFARDYSKNHDAPLELVEKTAKLLQNVKHVMWIWHGSEATVLGVDYYKQADEILKQYNITERNMQSNGVLLWRQEWIDYLKQSGVTISISYDGRFQDEYRGRAKDVEKSIKTLNDNNITFGSITVIGEHNVNALTDLYDDIKNVGIKYWQFNTVFPSPRSDFIPGDMAKVYEEQVYQTFMKYADDPDPVHVRNFEEFIPYMLGSGRFLCIFSGRCFDDFISITPDGEVIICDRWFDHFVGNVDGFNSVEEILNSEWFNEVRRTKQDRVANCEKLGCPFVDLCNGGCPLNALEGGDLTMPNKADCYERAAFITGLFRGLQDLDMDNCKNKTLLSILEREGFRQNKFIREYIEAKEMKA